MFVVRLSPNSHNRKRNIGEGKRKTIFLKKEFLSKKGYLLTGTTWTELKQRSLSMFYKKLMCQTDQNFDQFAGKL